MYGLAGAACRDQGAGVVAGVLEAEGGGARQGGGRGLEASESASSSSSSEVELSSDDSSPAWHQTQTLERIKIAAKA